MQGNKKPFAILAYIMLIGILSSPAYAVSIGVSPGRVNFDNLLKDGYAERTVRITTNSPQELTAHFEVSGEIAEWLRFEPESSSFSLSSGKPHLLKIIIIPPNDTRSDSYSGKIDIVTDRFGSPQGRAGSLIKAAVTLSLSAKITDAETIACRAGAFGIKDIEAGYPLELSYRINNDGNVRIRPKVKLDIFDQLQENLIISEEFTSPEILPTVETIFSKKIQSEGLGIGQYWAIMAVEECKASSLLSFSVVEKGGIIDKGTLEMLTNKLWAYVDEPIEILAVFRNTGPRIVSARFKGDIRLDDKIVEVIETEEIDVASGEKADLRAYFTPPRAGRYIVTGRVLYNKKLTFEKGSIINVNPRPEEKSRFFLLLIYLIILVTIIFMARKIIKAKKKI
ncbi:hypothetical protein KY366_06595 [Candidatus Woesearchaeota archaeon]|nr:hypothetical protein [Candidatus Woesearchaeota archaeon]